MFVDILVWNRQTFLKDPDTTRRQARLNPTSAWVTTEVPDLRIVDDALWDRVKARQAGIREAMNPAGVKYQRPKPERARRPDYLLSGLLRCNCCGSGYPMINKTRLGCRGARNRGDAACTNRVTIRRDALEERVLGGLRERLMHPDLIAAFVEEYRRAFNAAAGQCSSNHDAACKELVQTEKKIASILTAVEDGMYHSSMKAKMATLEARKAELSAQMAATPERPALHLHPSLGDRYLRQIEGLAAALQQTSTKREATTILQGLISEIWMTPDSEAPDEHRIELVGELAGISGLASGNQVSGGATCSHGARMRKPRRLAGAGFDSMRMVAWPRFKNCFSLSKAILKPLPKVAT